MESADRKAKAESFVRQYSFKVAADLPENELAQFLMENQSLEIARENKERDGIVSDFNQWLFAESPDRFVLARPPDSYGCEELMYDRVVTLSEMRTYSCFKERKELAETWLKFQTKYPEYSEVLPDTRPGGPPSIERLRSIMKNTEQDWESRRHSGFGRAKEKMVGFSQSLLSFSDLFSIIPEGDKYLSLFTGVISTTIKAAARHKEIAEGFSSALEEIGKEMSFSTRELKIHRTKNMERLAIRLYIRHAKFFCHFMTWYLSSSSRRLGTSLRNDFYTEVQRRVTEIQSVAKEIEREASLTTQISLQQTEAIVRSLGPIMGEHLERIDKRLELMAQRVGQDSRDHIVDHCDNLLYNAEVSNAVKLAANRDELVNHLHCIEGSQPSKSPSDLFQSSEVQNLHIPRLLPRVFLFTRSRLQQVSQHLQAYYPSTIRGESSQGSRDLANCTVSGLLVVRLKEWLTSPRSDLLWIIGSNSPFGNEASLATSHILDIAMSAKIPCISFKCTPITAVSHTPGDGKTRCTILLIALLYSIIHQLLCFVPETFKDAYDLEDAIQTMEGGENNIPKALEIIQTLLKHRTPLLLFILDGLELLEGSSTALHLRNLINILHSRQTDSRLKVLLGSQGFLVSCGHLDVDKRVDCTLLPRRRPGRAQPGGRFLGELDSFPM